MGFDAILAALNQSGCQFLLIGGYNFSLRHAPYSTLDVDVWIRDDRENRRRCEAALLALDAEWGATDAIWGPVKNLPPGWLDAQHVYSMLTRHGPLDVFRSVAGLGEWDDCNSRAVDERLKDGTKYRGISDADMLRSQLALSERERKLDRIRTLQEAIQRTSKQP
jgi:hypothetical protein